MVARKNSEFVPFNIIFEANSTNFVRVLGPELVDGQLAECPPGEAVPQRVPVVPDALHDLVII